MGMSSKPTMETSSGTLMPALARARMQPAAMMSLSAKKAVGRSGPVARYADMSSKALSIVVPTRTMAFAGSKSSRPSDLMALR